MATVPKQSTPISLSKPLRALAKGDAEKAEKFTKNFIKAIGKGLNKVMSKMGISTYMSYTGAQIFEAIGLQKAFVEKYFTGTPSNIEGIGVFEVAEESIRLAQRSVLCGSCARQYAGCRWRICLPYRVAKSISGPRNPSPSCSTRPVPVKYETYKEYAKLINDQTKRHLTLRGLFEFKPQSAAIPLEEVESAKEIVKRFATGAMVARFYLDRSAHHAGDCHEPDRRQVEYRRRW